MTNNDIEDIRLQAYLLWERYHQLAPHLTDKDFWDWAEINYTSTRYALRTLGLHEVGGKTVMI
jgi:hypothetical protein